MSGGIRVATACILAAGTLTAGCERRAPGPADCERFAYRALEVPADVRPLPPRLQAAIDELIVQCLTSPFDRELVRCVDEGQSAKRCLDAFRERVRRQDALDR